MVEKALSLNGINYSFAAPNVEETEDGDIHYQDIFSLVDESINMKQTSVILFKEYPLATAECGS